MNKLNRRSVIRQTLAAAALLSLLCLNAAQAQNIKKGETKFKAGDYAGALKEFEPLAKKGNARAQYYLGMMHMEGKGVDQDSMEGLELIREAAQKDDPDAQYQLGNFHLHGKYLERSAYKAIPWFTKAADNKNADKDVVAEAAYLAGRLYNNDLPTNKYSDLAPNRDRSAYYFNKSAKAGKVEAMMEMGKFHDERNNDREAIAWFSRADKNGGGNMELGHVNYTGFSRVEDTTVLGRIGYLYQYLKEDAEAIKYYGRDYEENKNLVSVDKIMNIYRKGGNGVQQNSQKCKEWMAKIGGRSGWRTADWCDNPTAND